MGCFGVSLPKLVQRYKESLNLANFWLKNYFIFYLMILPVNHFLNAFNQVFDVVASCFKVVGILFVLLTSFAFL